MKQINPASPHVIVLVGIPGAGKTTFAQRFADTFSIPYVNSSYLSRKYNLSKKAAIDLTLDTLNELTKTGKTLVVETDVDTKAKRQDISKYIETKGYRPMFVWVQTEMTEASRRATKAYPAGSGLKPVEFEKACSSFQPLDDKEKYVVLSGKHTYPTQLKAVLKQIALERPDLASTPKSPQAKRAIIR